MSHEARLLKRRKLSNAASDKDARPRRRRHIFTPYRTIGLISPTPVPFTSVGIGKTTFQITTSVGHSLQTYDIRRGLHLNFLTRPRTPQIITATKAWRDKVLCAWGGDAEVAERGVWIFKRGKKEAELEIPAGLSENITTVCVFGSWIVGVCESQLLVWKTTSLELYTELRGSSPIPFSGCVASLPTYLNKIIAGRSDGSCEIWNVSSAKLIYTILPPSTTFGAITAIEASPALSIAAIAYQNGKVLIHDVEADQTLITLTAGNDMPITSISFRTDGIGAGEDGRKAGVMATASSASGDVTLWDLNKGGRKTGVLRAAHTHPSNDINGGISNIEFLPGQAILVSSGLDNSLKTWIFDEAPFSPVPRILHQRCGHAAPVSHLGFLPTATDGADDTGKWLMSGSRDRSLWGWSLRRDAQSAELSQGSVQSKARKQGLLSASANDAGLSLKCPPITSFTCSLNRDGGIGALPGKQPIWQNAKPKHNNAESSAMTGWESVVTAHQDDSRARTWFWGRRRAGRWALSTGDGGKVSSVAMSPCGTFAVVGSDKGSIDMYNLQSGQHRQHFPARLTPMQAKQLRLDVAKLGLQDETINKKTYFRGQGRHVHAVVGLAVDETNSTIISAGADGRVKFWDFRSGMLEHELDWSLSTSILGMTLHRSSNLAAFTCNDLCIRMVDITTRRIVRELRPVRHTVEELAEHTLAHCVISSDARWVIASLASLVLIWDLSTGHLIDGLNLGGQCTGISLSPTGEYLATATDNELGVHIWSNRALFSHVPVRQLEDAELQKMLQMVDDTPTASGEGGHHALLLAPTEHEYELEDEMNVEIEADMAIDKMEELTSDMLSLSVLPRSKWQNLLHLDLIRERNKPVEPPKKPEKAPFFLPSLHDRQSSKSTALTNGPSNITTDISRVTKRASGTEQSSTFTSLLRSSASGSASDRSAFLDNLKQLSPSDADVEIRSLSTVANELVHFVQALTWLAQQRRDFELGQAWMAVFLRVHGDLVRNDSTLRECVHAWQSESARECQRVQRLAEYCGGVVSFLRAARV